MDAVPWLQPQHKAVEKNLTTRQGVHLFALQTGWEEREESRALGGATLEWAVARE